MLGSITRSLDDMHNKLGSRPFCSEFKYDGQRCQIHAEWFQDPTDEFRKELVSTTKELGVVRTKMSSLDSSQDTSKTRLQSILISAISFHFYLELKSKPIKIHQLEVEK